MRATQIDRFEQLDGQRRRLVRSGAEGLLLRNDERKPAAIRRDERRVRRNNELLSDENRP